MEPRAAYSESITVSVGSALPPPSPPPSPPPPPPPPLPPSLSATPRRASMSSCWSFSRCSAPHASSPMLSAPSELASGEPVTGGSLSGELAVDGALPGRIPPAVRCSFASVASAWSVLGSVRPWTALRRSKTARRRGAAELRLPSISSSPAVSFIMPSTVASSSPSKVRASVSRSFTKCRAASSLWPVVPVESDRSLTAARCCSTICRTASGPRSSATEEDPS